MADGARPEPPEACLSFVLSGPWAHFRRVEGNIVKQSYRVVPRTTVAGIVAAMLGIERDGYYDLFAPGESAVAVEPTRELRSMNIPENTLSTASEDLTTVPTHGKLRVKLPNPVKPRQQHNYEMLVDPAYRIDLALDDDRRYDELRRALAAGESHYVPGLGLSECLAEVEYLGEFGVTTTHHQGTVEVESAVPEATDSVVVEPGERVGIERSPGFMLADEWGRTTTRFVPYAYNPTAESLTVSGVRASTVDGRTVMFV